ncbi:hypothetical protein Emag_005247 [Eimeria magna]
MSVTKAGASMCSCHHGDRVPLTRSLKALFCHPSTSALIVACANFDDELARKGVWNFVIWATPTALWKNGTHQQPRRALGDVGSALAFLVAALALTYLLINCMRHLSKNVRLSSHQVRLLASNFPSEGEDGYRCPAPSGNEGQQSSTSIAEGDTGLAEPAEAAAAAQLQEMGDPAPPLADPPVQTRRHLPHATRILVEKTLLLLKQPAAVVSPILPLMKPEHCLSLIKTLCRIVAAELSAFSTVPPSLQPLRRQAAAAYIDLIDLALSTGATAYVAHHMGWLRDMWIMQRLLQRLAETPPETESTPMQYYLTIMECQQRVSYWMISQVLHATHSVARSVTAGYTVDSKKATFRQLQVLSALCVTRLHQIINSGATRYWIQRQQRLLKTTLVYSARDLSNAISQNPGTTSDRLNAITTAVLAAGGVPTSEWAPLPLTSLEQQQQLQGHQDSPQQPHQQHQGAPRLHPTEAYGLSPMPSMPPPAEQPPMMPQTHYIMPHGHQPPHAEHQTLRPFDSAQQDAEFPATRPESQPSSHYELSEEVPAPQVQLPPVYHTSHLSVPELLVSSTSFSAPAIPGGLPGDFSGGSRHSGSLAPPRATQPRWQQTPKSAPRKSSSEDEDAP